ncbi:MAG: hypothetical protein ABW217_13100 [Polyangiaceae bacterium]
MARDRADRETHDECLRCSIDIDGAVNGQFALTRDRDDPERSMSGVYRESSARSASPIDCVRSPRSSLVRRSASRAPAGRGKFLGMAKYRGLAPWALGAALLAHACASATGLIGGDEEPSATTSAEPQLNNEPHIVIGNLEPPH